MIHKIPQHVLLTIVIASLLFSQTPATSAQSDPMEQPAGSTALYLPFVADANQSGQPTEATPSENEAEVVAAAFNAATWTVQNRLGIGTETPAGPLHLNNAFGAPPSGLPTTQNGLLLGVQSRAGYKWIQSYGGDLALNPVGNKVGVGTTTPFYKFHVVSGDIGVDFGRIIVDSDLCCFTTISADNISIQNVLTGQSTVIRPHSIVVNSTTMNVPDYVFATDYPLLPLDEVRTYIAREKHLPNVPSAKTIQQGGLDMTAFQLTLLAKIEELTLYTLAQDEQIAALQQQNATFAVKLKALEAQE